MFSKILIANRGEIACRVIRTARDMGIRTVAVYSDADREALHVASADEAIHIGPAPARDSYLNGGRILEAARKTGAEAIHPGYGFLSENADFALACEKAGVVFIGPPASAIEAMGSKSAAKQIMEAASVPLVPGYHGNDQDPEILRRAAADIGYPVLLKATAGGGGKGMRQVWEEAEFDDALAAAQREAEKAFGDERMLVEKYLQQPRHVEIQVFCDGHGNAVYLAERDCSIQRRHQKVIEEAPAPGMTEELRREMGEAAVAAARAIDYRGAGTVEFLLDVTGDFYFMEMNTRLQVEHPVTEMITGQDLVAWQLQVAAGGELPLTQDQVAIRGHALEARIYAEDPANEFLPQTGHLTHLQTPIESRHVRIDTGVRQGDDIGVHYDPMIAKLVVWGETRTAALTRLCDALRQYRVAGLCTNIEFLYRIANSHAFGQAELDTRFIESHNEELMSASGPDLQKLLPVIALFLLLEEQQAVQAAGANSEDRWSPWRDSGDWRLNIDSKRQWTLLIDGEDHVVSATASEPGSWQVSTDMGPVAVSGELAGTELLIDVGGHRQQVSVIPHDGSYTLFSDTSVVSFSVPGASLGDEATDDAESSLSAPMNGTIVSLLVESGTQVEAGQPLLIMEAMKMEHTVTAPSAGTVNVFFYAEGELVDGGATLLDFSQAE